MADAAAQKREARRRRILENSENRLKQITGVYSNDCVKGSMDDTPEERIKDNKSTPSSSTSSDSSTVKESENVSNVESYSQSLPPKDRVTAESSWKSNSSNIGNSPTSSDFISVSETKSCLLFNFCQKARIHIIALAVIVRILLTSPFADLCGQSAVLPLLTIESAEWIYTKLHPTESEDSPSGLLGIAMMLSGIAPKKVSFLLRILNNFSKELWRKESLRAHTLYGENFFRVRLFDRPIRPMTSTNLYRRLQRGGACCEIVPMYFIWGWSDEKPRPFLYRYYQDMDALETASKLRKFVSLCPTNVFTINGPNKNLIGSVQ